MNNVIQKYHLPELVVEMIYKEVHKLYMKDLKREMEVMAIRFKLRSLFKHLPFELDDDDSDYYFHISVHRMPPFLHLLDDLIQPHDLQYILMAIDFSNDFYNLS